MLSFLVVDADSCQAVENAAIDIWHTNASGVYSAPIKRCAIRVMRRRGRRRSRAACR
jgi:protocatechuate 3,4-dioxygenase beta subunit